MHFMYGKCRLLRIDGICIWRHSSLYNQWRHKWILSAFGVSKLIMQPWVELDTSEDSRIYIYLYLILINNWRARRCPWNKKKNFKNCGEMIFIHYVTQGSLKNVSPFGLAVRPLQGTYIHMSCFIKVDKNNYTCRWVCEDEVQKISAERTKLWCFRSRLWNVLYPCRLRINQGWNNLKTMFYY